MIIGFTVWMIEAIKSGRFRKIFNLAKDMRQIRRQERSNRKNRKKNSVSIGFDRKLFDFLKGLWSIMCRKKPIQQSNPPEGTMIGHYGKREIFILDSAKNVLINGTTGAGKTVALSNFIDRGTNRNYPLNIIDGKGDTGTGSLLDICQYFCRRSATKLYVVNLSNPELSVKYNPFRHATPTMCKDMLINMSEWSEEHYKKNTERYLQRLIQLLRLKNIPLSFRTIINHMPVEYFTALSNDLLKDQAIDKGNHALNLEISKNSGKIASNAAARFSTIAESELGTIFADDGLDIHTAIRERAVILFVLNPLMYPESSPLMGKLAIIDAKQAVSKCYQNPIERGFYIFDEFGCYASSALMDLLNKCRSAKITGILATQSLSDLDFAVNEAYKEQVIENCNNYLVLRQNSGINAEHWAGILGTRKTMETTHQLQQRGLDTSQTGYGSAKTVREYHYHPDDIKMLGTGQGIFLSRDTNYHAKIKIHKPF